MRFTFLREWFPEQTKSIPAILIWLMVFLADVALVFWLAGKLGFELSGVPLRLSQVVVMLYIFIALMLFWLEAFIYNKIISLFR